MILLSFRERGEWKIMSSFVKRFFIGLPLETERLEGERLTKKKALAVFSSDALSSVAYATEEILWVLSLAGVGAFYLSIPIAISIVVLLLILTFSYRQTLHAYPGGGGSFIVAKENLGEYPGLIAGAALLIDYILTVAVSISAGVAALTSAFPLLLTHKVALALLLIALITLANLRGVRESANLFAIPTYIFIGSIILLIIGGLYKYYISGFAVVPPEQHVVAAPLQLVTIFLLMRGFAAGCTALTGVEAISNGVPAFQKPQSHNASITLIVMAVILMTMFLGITSLAHIFGISPTTHETVISQIARNVYGQNIVYYLIQASTMMVLVLAANTSYAGFPGLSSIMAKEGYLPRLLAMRGDRLVFSNGILALGVLAGVLVVIFKAETHLLLPLYAIGVFTSFTLSQSGMVMHWFKSKEKGWHKSATINALGAVVTAVATVIIASTKFSHGAWVVIVLVPFFVFIFKTIKNHYVAVAKQLTSQGYSRRKDVKHTIIVPIGALNRVALNTLDYARTLSPDVIALHISSDEAATAVLIRKWEELKCDARLEIMKSPYRSLIQPLIDFIDKEEIEVGDMGMVTVLIPEFMPRRWWQYFLHNQTGLLIKTAFLLRKDTVVASVPYHLKE